MHVYLPRHKDIMIQKISGEVCVNQEEIQPSNPLSTLHSATLLQ